MNNSITTTNSPIHQKIDAIQLAVGKMPQVELPLKHRFFGKGLYARRMFIPAGTIIVGEIHRFEHPFYLSKGSIVIWTEEGGTKQMTAPYRGISKAGARRIGFALTDTVWTTYHEVGEERDLTKVKEMLTIKREVRADEVTVNRIYEGLINFGKQERTKELCHSQP